MSITTRQYPTLQAKYLLLLTGFVGSRQVVLFFSLYRTAELSSRSVINLPTYQLWYCLKKRQVLSHIQQNYYENALRNTMTLPSGRQYKSCFVVRKKIQQKYRSMCLVPMERARREMSVQLQQQHTNANRRTYALTLYIYRRRYIIYISYTYIHISKQIIIQVQFIMSPFDGVRACARTTTDVGIKMW